ncbi:MAG: hypothetical protein ABL876_18920 [Chitinophagaceae bacterium]
MDEKPKLDVFLTYMAMIEGSVGSNTYRKMYYVVDGVSMDVLFDGDLACAVFATFILFPFGLIKEWHTTVNETVRDIEESGWYKIPEPRKGALILWGFKKKDDGTQGKHRHVGFYIDSERAVSNDSDTRVPVFHHPTYGTFPDGETRRDIQAYYWHDMLN